MLSTNECYTVVLLECGPPQHPGNSDALVRRFMVVQDRQKEWTSALHVEYHAELLAALNRMANMMERDDISVASFLQWYEKQI